ncbi:MAG TPA: hypothetical protein VGJ77_15795, partial [Gaiellaceae bacterium]|jgi:ABC-type transporter Mla subunit MlaD
MADARCLRGRAHQLEQDLKHAQAIVDEVERRLVPVDGDNSASSPTAAAFMHGGRSFVVTFARLPTLEARYAPVFARSAASLRFA